MAEDITTPDVTPRANTNDVPEGCGLADPGHTDKDGDPSIPTPTGYKRHHDDHHLPGTAEAAVCVDNGQTINITSTDVASSPRTDENDDDDKTFISVEAEIGKPIEDDADLEPYAVAHEFQNTAYGTACNTAENDAQQAANDIANVPVNRLSLSAYLSSIQNALNWNPIYRPNVPQQAAGQCTCARVGVAVIIFALSAVFIFVGIWLYFNDNVRDVKKPTQVVNTTYTPGHPAVDTTYTPGHPAVDTTHTPGHPAVDTTYTPGHPAVDTTYTPGHPAVDTTYTPGHPATYYIPDEPIHAASMRKWRDDWRCGQGYPAENGHPAECDLRGERPCCSPGGWCGPDCDCQGCVDYRIFTDTGTVVIFNRMDCCSERLNPFNIHIGDSDQVSENPKCGGDHHIGMGRPSITVSCQGMKGRHG
ncbi:PREDICTED: uncharacterized protein LOC109471781 [Branchiostoma belcheri]|uniref:Uncharacterized protein LOC109471781 n=1 Tax=Branchiostoma belcheri TaxID=7741 RepID=A0A6P4YQM8_BRABE|nr:PREDICTED: uncharacterized protein LOC109471781 [Branchiostoma belcheri]